MRPLNHPQNRWYAGQMDAWRKVAAHLAVWDYWKLYYEQYPAPKTLISNLPDYLRRYRDLGVIHLFAEAEIAAETACRNVSGNVRHRADIGTEALFAKRIAHMKELRG